MASSSSMNVALVPAGASSRDVMRAAPTATAPWQLSGVARRRSFRESLATAKAGLGTCVSMRFILLVGMTGSIGLIASILVEFLFRGELETYHLALFFAGPCLWFFARLLSMHDAELRAEQEREEELSGRLRQSLDEATKRLEDKWKNAADMAFSFAGSAFRTERDLFLQNIKDMQANLSQDVVVTCDADILADFKQFTMLWMSIFVQWLPSERGSALKEKVDRELSEAHKFHSACEVVVRCLANVDVDYRVDGSVNAEMESSTTQGQAGGGDLEAGRGLVPCCQGQSGPHGENAGRCCDLQVEIWPVSLTFCWRITVTIFSREHLAWSVVFVLGCFITAMEEIIHYFAAMLLCIVTELCLGAVLLNFRNISEIQRLRGVCNGLVQSISTVETQIQQADYEEKEIVRRQNLWLYHTTPCLQIFQQIHSQIKDRTTTVAKVAFAANEVHEATGKPVDFRKVAEASDALQAFVKSANRLALQAFSDPVDVDLWCGPLSKSSMAEYKKQVEAIAKKVKEDPEGGIEELGTMLISRRAMEADAGAGVSSSSSSSTSGTVRALALLNSPRAPEGDAAAGFASSSFHCAPGSFHAS